MILSFRLGVWENFGLCDLMKHLVESFTIKFFFFFTDDANATNEKDVTPVGKASCGNSCQELFTFWKKKAFDFFRSKWMRSIGD